MALDPRLKQLLESWEDARDAGRPPTPEEHCRDAPELLEPFRKLLRQLDQIDPERMAARAGGPARATLAEASLCATRFRVEGEPLRGGMGEVFPARDEFGRLVALKFMQRGKDG